MGDSHQKRLQLQLQRAFKTQIAVPPSATQMAVLCQLDLATHVLLGMADQTGNIFGAQAAATEIQNCARYLQIYRKKFVEEQTKKVVLASPPDVPSMPEAG